MIRELDTVVLTTDLPEYGLVEGDVGAVVMVHSGGVGFEVEFVTLDGKRCASSRWIRRKFALSVDEKFRTFVRWSRKGECCEKAGRSQLTQLGTDAICLR
jgi:hypothetical protein